MASKYNRVLPAIIAAVGWLGVLLQLKVAAGHALAQGQEAWRGIVDALCYFTVLTNILVSLTATMRALGTRSVLTRPSALAASAVYIAVVALIYSLLLRSLWAPEGVHRIADQILHDLTPLLYVLWWVLWAPKGGLHFRDAVWWLGYPLAYFAFSLLLGAASGRYLYPFADVAAHGLPAVARNGVMLLALFLLLGTVLVAAARVLPGRERRV